MTQFGELYAKHADKGLEILGFPCNQLGAQEPGTNAEIKEWYHSQSSYSKKQWPLFAPVEVNGNGCHPLYKHLRENSSMKGSDITWNFGKFLLDGEGTIHGYYLPDTVPEDMVDDIEKLL